MRNPLLAPELRELLVEGRKDALVEVLSDLHPLDAASILSGLEPEEIMQVTQLLPLQLERDIFEYLDPDVQESIIVGSGRDRVKALLTALSSDERAAFMDRLSERVRDQVFPLLTKAIREDLVRRDHFADDQVGGILSTEYCALSADLTVVRALEEVRRQAPDRETIYVCYVVDDQGRLQGTLSLRDLLVARSHQTVGQIMRSDPVSLLADADQADAARLIRAYDLIALPVVDGDGRLVGIVTHDDAADIIEEEGTEDIELQAGITGGAEADDYGSETVFSHFRRRVPWGAALALLSIGTVATIDHFAGLLQIATLTAFLPMVLSTGGNVGAQTSTVIVRGLAVGHVDARDMAFVLWKELRISLCLAVVLCTIVFAEVQAVAALQDGVTSAVRMGLTIALALALQIVTAALLGAAIPLGVSRLKLDPALVANPALTTLADLSGALIYLLTVALLLSP